MVRNRSKNIAITGIAARFPQSKDIEEWWLSLKKGKVLTRRYNKDDLLIDGLDPCIVNDNDYVPIHGHLDDANRFDNQFFRVTARDAELMDPQHRLMLEVAWCALEDAGYGKARGRPKTGVFASGSGSNYARTIMTNGPLDPESLEQLIHGTDADFIASLISYKLGLTGPSIGIQTACSSSLVSLHLAVQSLLNNECDQAIVVAAGIAFPQAGHLYIPGGIKSKSGRCRPFDENADGVVEGSGAACVVLEKAKHLANDSPPPYGMILGTAINNDGSSKAGYFAPSVIGQIEVIQSALKSANIDASSIGYIETHGTGTNIGDPIEWESTSEAYKEFGANEKQIYIGALKANIGHLDAAAGLSALIKTLYILKEGYIPPLAEFEKINPLLDTHSPLCIPEKGITWKSNTSRRAAINAFGVGGTNAHIIVEEIKERRKVSKKNGPFILPLSAKDEKTLSRLSQHVSKYIERADELTLLDASYTLIHGREEFQKRLVATGKNATEISLSLVANKIESSYTKPNIIFAFPGQGSQYPGMASHFKKTLPFFQNYILECLEFFSTEMKTIIYEALYKKNFPAEKLNQTEFSQPILFVIEYAIGKSLEIIGIKPDAVLGHSLGEITAAQFSGVLILKDAINLVCARGKAMQNCSEGAMLALNCTQERTKDLIFKSKKNIYLAAINTPESCVVTGSTQDIKDFQSDIDHSVQTCLLKNNRGFHSPLIYNSLDEIEKICKKLDFKKASLPLIINATGQIIQKGETLSHTSFVEQAKNTVLFAESLRTITRTFENPIIVEVGPGKILSSMALSMGINSQCLLTKPHDQEDTEILNAIGKLWSAGCNVNFSHFCIGGRKSHIPTYPFFGPKWLAPEAYDGLRQNKKIYQEAVIIKTPKEDASQKKKDTLSLLKSIWSELLRCNDINESSDFYSLGGDSLLATSLVRRINKTFNIESPPRKIIAATKLSHQASIIEELISK